MIVSKNNVKGEVFLSIWNKIKLKLSLREDKYWFER